MPQPPETNAPTYLMHLPAIIGGLVAVILSLVGFITHGFQKTQETHQDQLDAGALEFTNLKLVVQHLETDNKALREWCIELEKDLDEAQAEIKSLHDFKIALCIHHFNQHGEKIEV